MMVQENRTFASQIGALTRLRVVVAYLGETDRCRWWPTSFLSVTGRRYLEFNFPRTVLSAGVSSASYAARELHDQRIGSSGVFHLFRLPHGLEQDIHALLASELREDLASLIQGHDPALAALDRLSEGECLSNVGPVRVATLDRLLHRPSIKKIAAYYRGAVEGGHQTYPYFTSE